METNTSDVLSVFGGGKYEKYFKYINTHNLSSFIVTGIMIIPMAST